MIKNIFILGLISSFSIASGQVYHTDKGTDYGQKAVLAYTESNHGPDGKLFLDPYFKKDLENLNNEKILDAGCGAAPWSIYAARNGGDVYAIDIQENMIIEARHCIENAHLTDKISITQGDVAALPYESDFFDKAISICVFCNLPPEAFEKHLSELARTLKTDGTAIIGAPTSLDNVFTIASKSKRQALSHINAVLNQLPDDPKAELVQEELEKLDEVLSATFFLKNHRITLVTDEKELSDGEKIWRKLPKLVVPNRFYSQETYMNMLKKFNFKIIEIDQPHFVNNKERELYNKEEPPETQLGVAYVKKPPFVIFHVKK